MDTKRLFLFAGYDKQGIVDASLMHYLSSLSRLGDIVFVMDNDSTASEIDKVKQIPNVLYANAQRHGEYDFGSYKRAYAWADANGLMEKYDWIYLVNDSVYGPLFDIKDILVDLESRGADLTGMIDLVNNRTPYQVQSWFLGLSQRVANSDFIREFMKNISAQVEKQLIVLKYEVGLSQLILRHGYKISTYISGENSDVSHRMYGLPLEILKAGVPFVKKNGLYKMPGLQYMYPYTSDLFVDNLYHSALRTGVALPAPERPAHAPPVYKKIYRLTLWSVPLLTIRRQDYYDSDLKCYKAYLFDAIPLVKVFRHK